MAHTLDVPGARLWYDVQGSGPVLLLIPGGPADGGVFARIAPALGERYTVVTYDPRGIGRSTREDAAADIGIGVQADDVSRILMSIGTPRAYVFGNSGGAVTGLELITRHPDCVRALVAHEPPVVALLPEARHLHAQVETIHATFRARGASAALSQFLAFAGFAPRAASPTPSAPPPAAPPVDGNKDMELFLGHMLRPITGYVPDAAALRGVSARVRVGAGRTSAGQTAHRSAVALAEFLGTPIVDFPGGHGGFSSDVEAFARVLHATLTALDRTR